MSMTSEAINREQNRQYAAEYAKLLEAAKSDGDRRKAAEDAYRSAAAYYNSDEGLAKMAARFKAREAQRLAELNGEGLPAPLPPQSSPIIPPSSAFVGR